MDVQVHSDGLHVVTEAGSYSAALMSSGTDPVRSNQRSRMRPRLAAGAACLGLAGIGLACSSGSSGVGVLLDAHVGQTLVLHGTFGEAAVTIVSVTDPAVPAISTPSPESGDHYLSVEERVTSPSGHLHEEVGLETSVDTTALTDLGRETATDAIRGCPPLPEFAIFNKTSQSIDGCLAIQVPNGSRVEDVKMQMYYGTEGDWSVP
jgi:hypothetical protein